MRLLILGGGSCQLSAIKRGKQKGLEVIITDYYMNPLGKKYADFHERVSTFDIQGNIDVAKKYQVDGVVTLGTDQPVLTAAKVAECLKIPSFIDVKTATAVTNKKVMKTIYNEHDIPTVNYRLIKQGFDAKELHGLKFPVVVKPVDSQGQRGVFKLNTLQEVRDLFQDVLTFSREEEILVEEFYDSDEITVSGWVRDDKVHILTVTDRISNSKYPYIGVCTAHNYPSIYMDSRINEIERVTKKIVQAFEIHNGPIYFQMLVGEDGVKVNEIACRIGGAYEDQLLPLVSGVDILDMQLKGCLGMDVNFQDLERFAFDKSTKHVKILLFFLKEGKIAYAPKTKEIKELSGVINLGYNFKVGDVVEKMVNASQRAGYLMVEGNSKEELAQNVGRALDKLLIKNQSGENMVIRFKDNNGRFIK